MRIGILTLPLHTNYGGILQAYALQTVLERMGHEVEVLNALPSFAIPIYWKYPLRWIKKWLVDDDIIVARETRERKEYPVISKEIEKFKKQRIHLRVLSCLSDIKEGDYDAIVVGSDQIWRPLYFKPMWKSEMANAFLEFTKKWNIKRIAYAASFGVDIWEFTNEETIRCKAMAKLFDGVTVREKSGIDLCRKYLNIPVIQALDPTALLSVKDYIELFKDTPQKNNREMLCYILDKDLQKQQLISQIAKERKLTSFLVDCSHLKKTTPVGERILPSIEDWLQGFYNAEFVVTDSFHACVFSILFKKPFIAIGNTKRGMCRFSSLLNMFGLNDHLINDVSEYNPEYDYSIHSGVDETLNMFRQRSLEFLISNLK